LAVVPGTLEAIDEDVLMKWVVANCDGGGISRSGVRNEVVSIMAFDEKILMTIAVSDGYGGRIGIFVEDGDSACMEIEILKWAT
jgi:hypothetical protein